MIIIGVIILLINFYDDVSLYINKVLYRIGVKIQERRELNGSDIDTSDFEDYSLIKDLISLHSVLQDEVMYFAIDHYTEEVLSDIVSGLVRLLLVTLLVLYTIVMSRFTGISLNIHLAQTIILLVISLVSMLIAQIINYRRSSNEQYENYIRVHLLYTIEETIQIILSGNKSYQIIFKWFKYRADELSQEYYQEDKHYKKLLWFNFALRLIYYFCKYLLVYTLSKFLIVQLF